MSVPERKELGADNGGELVEGTRGRPVFSVALVGDKDNGESARKLFFSERQKTG